MPNETESDAGPIRIRWWPAILIIVAGVCWFVAVQVLGWYVTHPARDLVYGFCALNVAYYVWARVASGLSQSGQLGAILCAVALQGLAYGMVRVDGFDGDGRIVFQWRWTPTPEQRMDQFSHQTQAASTTANVSSESSFDSPSFRGRQRTGVIRNPKLLLDWQTSPPRELWRHPVGRGWASFSVVGDFCVTQEQLDGDEAVVCYELKTGNQIWQHRYQAFFDEATSGPGPRATPTIVDGKVYSFGATGILNCLDARNGQPVWTRHVAGSESALFGFSGSPLVHGELVYVAVGGSAGAIVALHRDTGQIVWSSGTTPVSYSSPQLLSSTESQVLIIDASALHAYDSKSGDALWSFPWGTGSEEEVNVCQPVVLPSTSDSQNGADVLISSGYGRGAVRISVNFDGKVWRVTERWQSIKLKSKFSCVVTRDGFVYGLDQGILVCLSLDDGSLQWKKGRYGHGQLLLINDKLLIQAESGRVFLIAANPQRFKPLGELAGLSDKTWNHPVVAGPYLLIRNDREAACYRLNEVTE